MEIIICRSLMCYSAHLILKLVNSNIFYFLRLKIKREARLGYQLLERNITTGACMDTAQRGWKEKKSLCIFWPCLSVASIFGCCEWLSFLLNKTFQLVTCKEHLPSFVNFAGHLMSQGGSMFSVWRSYLHKTKSLCKKLTFSLRSREHPQCWYMVAAVALVWSYQLCYHFLFGFLTL